MVKKKKKCRNTKVFWHLLLKKKTNQFSKSKNVGEKSPENLFSVCFSVLLKPEP